MKLYYSPGACSLSPHIALREAGIPVELKKVDLPNKQIEGGGDYWQINGKGYVPAIELPGGAVLTEGPAIVQYIADQAPQSGLAPKAGTIERYRLQEWLNFITAEFHKNFSPLFNRSASPEWKAGVTANLHKRFAWLEKQLAGKQYIFGDQFTVADGYLFTVLNWAHMVQVSLAEYPAIQAFVERVRARPKVREALMAEGLIK
jgi:glutathione S-transferase